MSEIDPVEIVLFNNVIPCTIAAQKIQGVEGP